MRFSCPATHRRRERAAEKRSRLPAARPWHWADDNLLLAAQAAVDGHDMGSNEANVFIFSHAAPETFLRCLPAVERFGLLDRLAAGYRDVDGEDYTRIWPHPSTAPFSVK